MEFKPTKRGFLRATFQDRYGSECSVQESSLAGEDCIWLGVEVDFQGNEVPRARMHLTQQMARDLIPVLRHFARSGRLGVDSPEDSFRIGAWVRGVGDDNRGVEGRIISINKGEFVTVQDFDVPGVSGQHTYIWGEMDLHWEPIETPEKMPSRYDVLSDDDGTTPVPHLPAPEPHSDGSSPGPQGVRGQDEDPDL